MHPVKDPSDLLDLMGGKDPWGLPDLLHLLVLVEDLVNKHRNFVGAPHSRR